MTYLTLEPVSTFISVVMFLFFNWVLTSARNRSPFFVADDAIAYNNRKKEHRTLNIYSSEGLHKLYI